MSIFRFFTGSKLGFGALHDLSLFGVIFAVVFSVLTIDAIEAWISRSFLSFYEPSTPSYREFDSQLEGSNYPNVSGALSVCPRSQGSSKELLSALPIRGDRESISLGVGISKARGSALSHNFRCSIHPAPTYRPNLARNDKFISRLVGWNENRADSEKRCRNGAVSLKISNKNKV